VIPTGPTKEAIRRVCEAFDRGKRRALIVMATGTGKTRVATSLVDVLLRSNQARRVLFVADRDPLVQQALTDGFKQFLPDEPCTRIHSYNIERSNRLYVATLQTLSNCFQDFTPGFFDAIFFDEVHRSIFNKWNEVLLYFDARMIGLTATPAEFLDRNTFREFDCEGNRPTFLYSYPQAVKEEYLVDFDLYSAKTRFQRKGIRGVDLNEEERNILIDQGLDPDALDYSGTEIERTVSNRDTLRKQWEEIWEQCIKDKSGQLPGKTIVFAMTQEHALRLADAFEEMFPQFPGLVRVITYKSEFKGTLIEKFKKADQPRIAITVDLLETGIDVPEAVNLVFMRPVHSAIKLWQMIGRGTRGQAACTYLDRLPEGGKRRFLILDFWENDFNRSPDPEQAQSLPVLVSLFNTRLAIMEHYLDDQSSPEAKRTVGDLRGMVARIPTDSLLVKRVYPEVEPAWRDSWWFYLNASKLEFLLLKVGPLLRYAPDPDVEAATFTHKVERLKLILEGEDLTPASIAEDVSRLPDYVFENPHSAELARLCLTPQLQTATASQLNAVIDALAGEMRNRSARENTFVLLYLPDYVEMRGTSCRWAAPSGVRRGIPPPCRTARPGPSRYASDAAGHRPRGAGERPGAHRAGESAAPGPGRPRLGALRGEHPQGLRDEGQPVEFCAVEELGPARLQEMKRQPATTSRRILHADRSISCGPAECLRAKRRLQPADLTTRR
jgi:type I restriction enzyme R subunit